MESEHQVPIWFFIGVILLIYGILITGSGIAQWVSPPPEDQQVALFYLHADVWWGALLIVLGAAYCLRFHPFGATRETT